MSHAETLPIDLSFTYLLCRYLQSPASARTFRVIIRMSHHAETLQIDLFFIYLLGRYLQSPAPARTFRETFRVIIRMSHAETLQIEFVCFGNL